MEERIVIGIALLGILLCFILSALGLASAKRGHMNRANKYLIAIGVVTIMTIVLDCLYTNLITF